MARVSSVLGLSLILCYCHSQDITLSIKMISQHPRAIDTQVELGCDTFHSDATVSWIRLTNGLKPEFILNIRSNSKSKVTSTNQDYEGSKSGNTYKLIVKKFKKQDEGNYYCLVLYNQVVYFSPILSVSLPVRTTQAPTTHRPPTDAPKPKHTTNESKKCQDDSNEDPYEDQIIPCKMYIWVPLSGGCFLLLMALVISMTVCYNPRRRRRRCQCKRPLNGTNGKPTMPH